MSSFILPLTIDSRKIIFLDLETRASDYLINMDADEDEYIIERDYLNPKSIISISDNHEFQSLSVNEEDHLLANISFEPEFNSEKNMLSFELKKLSSTPSVFSNTGQNDILVKKHEKTLEILLRQQMAHSSNKLDHLYVRFFYTSDNNVYEALMLLHFVEKTDIKFVGLDFGSEASQMIEGYYNPNNLSRIEQNFTNIFSDIKSNNVAGGGRTNELHSQYEKEGNYKEKLYKSIFFIKKVITLNYTVASFDPNNFLLPTDSIKFITELADETRDFFKDWMLVPNLKLIHNHSNLTSQIGLTIKLKDAELNVDFSSIKRSVYRRLLSEMIETYLKSHIHKDAYLSFTVLIPNIYSITEILDTKKIIRNICKEFIIKNNISIIGLEVSSISESDASFYGISPSLTLSEGDFYITVDCGKGTTDFSLIKIDEKDSTIKIPVYKGGFAGAGNLINYAFLESMIYFIRFVLNQKIVSDEKLKKYFEDIFSAKTDSKANLNKKLYDLTEKCKKNYDSSISELDVTNHFEKIQWGNINFETWLENLRDDDPDTDYKLTKLLDEVHFLYNWNNYIKFTVEEIAKNIVDSLSNVTNFLNQSKSKCAGVILTGRAFLFNDLQKVVGNQITSMKGMKNQQLIFDTEVIDKKTICLQGILERNIKSFADVASSPIEIPKGSLRRIKKSDVTESFIKKIMLQIKEKIISPSFSVFGNSDFNKTEITQTNFSNTQFLSGGLIYSPSVLNHFESGQIINTRKGYFIIAKNLNGERQIVELKINNLNPALLHLKNFAIKSLIPGIVEIDIIDSLKNKN